MGTVHAKQYSNQSFGSPFSDIEMEPENAGKERAEFSMQDMKNIKARVDKVHVEGLGRTKDDIVINSLSKLFSAQDFTEVIMSTLEVKTKLEKLGCFKNISATINTSSGKEASPDGLEVTFKVREWSRITGGVNTLIGSNEGSLLISTQAPNLLGRGENLVAEYSYGCKRSNTFNINFVKPIIGPANATFTSGIFQSYSEQPNSGYKQVDRGMLLDLGFTSAPLVKHNVQWETVWRDLSILNNTTAFEVREMSGPSLKGSLRHILSVDRRDRRVFPRTGTLFSLITEYAGIGGNVNFLKNEMQFQVNVPVKDDVVLQGALHGGIVRSVSSKPVSICDNFFLGGPLSLRGFQTRGVGPQAKLSNALGASEFYRSFGVVIYDGKTVYRLPRFIVAGVANPFLYSNVQVYWSGALHLFTPLPFRPKLLGLGDSLRTHFFINAGNIGNFEFTDDYNHNLNLLRTNMRVAYGFGLAARLGPDATVELNYCFPWIFERSDLTNQGLQFGIGIHFL